MNWEFNVLSAINALGRIAEKARAYDLIDSRTNEALDYIGKYKVGMLGRPIWHCILDDAIKLRESNGHTNTKE